MRFSHLSDWLSWQERLHPNAIDLGLDRVHRTLARLQWQRPACPIIIVGGTNGKGSSVALLSGMLAAAGYRVGTFTSPHLIDYNERITIAGRYVSDASLVAAFERIDAARGEDTLTFFEFNTLAALLVFETAGLDAMVLEVGMGGRLDAVNVVDADAALITSVALDHCEWLGNDVEVIGREKAGIFRRDRPAVYGSWRVPQSIEQVADDTGADLLMLGRDFSYARGDTHWSWQGRRTQLEGLPAPALIGDVQFDNAASVLAVLESLTPRVNVGREAIEHALIHTRLVGRFQVIDGPIQWILDVAHNPAAAQTLAAQLRARAITGRTMAVCGMLGDKDIEGVAAELSGCFDTWMVAGLEGGRAIPADQVAQRLQSSGASVAGIGPTMGAACEAARKLAVPGDRIVVFGSFLAVAPALQWLQERG